MVFMITENSIFYNNELSNEDYHADPAIGSSGMKEFLKCPALYYAKYIDPKGIEHRKNTKRQTLGSNAHVSLLEPEKFEQEYLVSPQTSITNKGKSNQAETEMTRAHADWKEFVKQSEAQGKKPILWNEYTTCCDMTAHLMNDPLAKACLTNVGQNECSFFVKVEKTGIMRKSRPDRIVDLKGLGGYKYVIVDYKTTGLSLDEESQNKYIYNEKRFLQAACHKSVPEDFMGVKIDTVIYITQMSEYPYLIQCYELPKEDIDLGHEMMRNALEGYTDYNGKYRKGIAECMKDGIWPGFPGGILTYTRPSWMNYTYN